MSTKSTKELSKYINTLMEKQKQREKENETEQKP